MDDKNSTLVKGRKKKSNNTKKVQWSKKNTRQFCHKDFWKFASHLLDDKTASRVSPTFTDEYFCSTYQSHPKTFDTPFWMQTPKPPKEEFDRDHIQEWEIVLLSSVQNQNLLHHI